MPFDLPTHSGSGRQRPLARAIGAAMLVVALGAAAPAGAKPAPDSFSPLAKRVTPAVVNVQTVQSVGGPQRGQPGMPDGPFREFFERFFGDQMPQFERRGPGGPQPRERRAIGAGSGFLIGPEGFIVTNNHVVGEADEITVTLHDGTEYPAELIGVDGKTDLALVKIDADKPLPYVSWGDSDVLEVGDWVMAVGNPFGLGGTVTAGIVSARGRDIGSGPYDDFIQTDASINRGNSGGPLFDMDGRVVGVNTAIFSPSGGNIGIGFAIPATMARNIVEQLKSTGTVERGWLGVQIQQVTPEIADSLGMDTAEGALVGQVNEGGPAAEGGIRTGDVILEFAGERIEEMRELPRVVADTRPGSRVGVTVRRKGREVPLTMTLGTMPEDPQVAGVQPDRGGQENGGGSAVAALGLRLADLTGTLRNRFEIPADQRGVLVLGRTDDSKAPLQPGDLIMSLNQEDVSSTADVEKALDAARRDGRKSVLALVSRNGQERFVALPLGSA